MPVRNLVLSRIDDAKPVLTWEAGESGIQGYHIYRNGSRITTTPTTSTSYSDGYYSSGAVTYGISSVNGDSTESPVREVTLPIMDIGLKAGTALRRGVLEKIIIVASQPDPQAPRITLDSVALKIGTLPESTQTGPFAIPADSPLEISKVGATDSQAQPQTGVSVTGIIKPAAGVTVKITKSATAGVIAAGAPMEIFNEPMSRGTQGKVRIKITNTGSARSEYVTSENNGPSSQMQVTLKDQDGNILAKGQMNQRSGDRIIDSGSYATLRLEPGETFLSDPITFSVPISAPTRVILEASATNSWYHYKQEDQVMAPGLTASVESTVSYVSYSAAATTDKQLYKQGEAITVTGTAISTEDGKPMANVPVKIGISVKGFDRYATVSTDATGAFSYNFVPGAGESGSYSVWAIHPDLNDRTIQAQFSIIGLTVSPTSATVRLTKGQGYDIPVTLTNTGGSPLTALAFATSASSGMGASVVNQGATVLNPGETRTVTFRTTAEQGAPDSGFATLEISTAEGLGSRIDATITTITAIPVIATTPSYIDTGLMRGNQRVENITIRNTGAGTLVNPRIEGPSLPWLILTSDKNIGDIPAGQSRSVGVQIVPSETLAQGVYDDRIVIYSDNHIPYTFNIQVTVTSSAVGNVQFSVMDELMKDVKDASITFQHQSLPELYYTVKTGADGTISQFDIPEGRYSYNVSASGRKGYSGSFVIIPGITTTVPVAMEVTLVTVEWSVTPVLIQDRYQITVSQTFEAEVPTSVLLIEPAVLNVPDIQPGQVYNGEFSITNKGLISAQYHGLNFPQSFSDYDIEVLAALPLTINATQKVTVPYRVTRKQAQQ